MQELADHPVVSRWCDVLQYNQGRREGTIYHYRRHLLGLAEWLAEQPPPGRDLLQVRPDELELYTGKVLHERKLRPPARRVAVAGIRGFFDWCENLHLVALSPASGLPSPRIATRMPRAAQLGDVEKILMKPNLDTFQGLRDSAMLFVLTGTGCRVSGLCNLNEGDLIWSKDNQGRERLIIRFTEKGKKERMVPAPIEAGLMIRAYLGHSALEEINRVLPNGDSVLFVNLRTNQVQRHNHYGEYRRIARSSVDRIIAHYGEMAGVKRSLCHAHALRHLYGAELAEDDVDLIKRMVLLGHAKPETTEIYSHLAMRNLFETVDRSNPLGKIKTVVTGLANQIRSQKVDPVRRKET